MSFANRLGAQGAALLQNQFVMTNSQGTPSELDYLLNDLVSSNLPIDKITSYLAYYYPKIKNKINVEILTTTFLRSTLFQSIESLSVEVNSKLIDCFQYIVTEKYKITNPTLSFVDFYSSIYTSLTTVIQTDPNAHWKIVPILTGCISALSQLEQYNLFPSYSNIIKRTHKLYLRLYADAITYLLRLKLPDIIKDSFVVSLVYIQEYIDPSLSESLILVSPQLLTDITRILFISPSGLDNGMSFHEEISYRELMKQKSILRLLNKWAFLYSKLLRHASIQSIADSLVYVVSFSSTLMNSLDTIKLKTDKWDLVKYTFFSIILILESAMKRVSEESLKEECVVVCGQAQRSLFYLSFVLDQIGTGGFDSYQFVFDSSSFILEKNHEVTNALEYTLLNEISLNMANISAIETSKLNYFLRLTEAVLSQLDELFLSSTLLPLLNGILNTRNYPTSTIEFAHSVMVKHISLSEKSPIIYSYFDKTLSQFPEILSLNQASLIFRVCARKSECATVLFDLVKFNVAKSSYSPLPPTKTLNNGNEVIIPEKLLTRKAGMIHFLIEIVEFVEPHNFVFSLNEIKALIDSLIGDRDIYTLYDTLWTTILAINKVDTWKGQSGIEWWYDNVNNGQVPKL